MNTSRKRYLYVLLTLGGLLLVCATAVVFRNYQAVMAEFASEPAAEISQHPERVNIRGLEQVSLMTQNGIRIAGWYAPSRNKAAVVIVHGTNADRSSMLAETQILADDGFGVLAIDWPGCGGSSGTLHWNAEERGALESAVSWVTMRNDVSPDKIGGLGFSMGAYTLAQVAATDKRIHAVVLEAAPPDFLEYVHWGHHRWGVVSEFGARLGLLHSHMPIRELRPIDVIKRISPRRLLLIGGDEDTVVPAYMVRELYKASQSPVSLWIVKGATHGGYLQAAPSQYPLRLTQFFESSLLHNNPDS